MIVNKGDRCILPRDAVDGYTRCAGAFLRACDSDVVNRFTITVVHREALPIRRNGLQPLAGGNTLLAWLGEQ